MRVAVAFGLVGLLMTSVGLPDAVADDQPAARSTGATVGGYPVWAHFSNPRVNAGRDYAIHNELRRLIGAAPAGSTIKGTIYSMSIDPVADALLDAQTRGVTVMVVLDGKNENSTDPAIATVKRLANHRFCRNADGGSSCISTSGDGDMHTKMFTFTATTDPNGVSRTNVAWFGSANLTYATGPDAFNNAITVYGDAALTTGLNANFTALWLNRHYPGNDYYDAASDRGFYQATAADAYASPESVGQTDTVATRLNDLTPDANCRLRIGMAAITAGRPALVQLVQDFRAAGCRVWLTVGSDATDGIAMNQDVYHQFLAAGVAIRRISDFHGKFFLAYGRYGTSYQYRVYTGSQNWTQDALNENDEIFVKMGPESGATHPLYDAYHAHFNDAYNFGVTCTVANFPCR